MRKEEIIFNAERKGFCIYEVPDGKKMFYKIRIPTFSNGKVIPTGYEDILVRNIKEVRKKTEEIWENNDEFRAKASAWVRTW
jgi:hypothetical protein